MRSVLSSFAFGALLAISAVVSAAGAPGPEIGTWKLNTAKSTGNVPRSETRTYAASADGIVIDYHRVGADGKESSVHATVKYDGKDYPVTGSPDFDALSARRVGVNTVEGTQKRNGKVIGTSRRTVSRDGKTLTLISRRANEQGGITTTTLIYDRQ
jgi:hypothetical protein